MKVVHKKDYKKQLPEDITSVDSVDRSGYVPRDLKFWQMMASGINLEKLRTLEYGYDYHSVLSAIDEVGFDEAVKSTSLRRPHIDKQTADTLLKNKLMKYKDIKSKHEQIDELKNKYFADLEDKRREQEIINRYKAEQEKLKNI